MSTFDVILPKYDTLKSLISQSDTPSYTSILDKVEVVKTPEQWHQEHLSFLNMYSEMRDANLIEIEELEAVVYFDYNHAQIFACCSKCMEPIAKKHHLLNSLLSCKKCGFSQKCAQSVRAAYLAMLGVKHADCTLTDFEFKDKTQSLDFVQWLQDSLIQSELNEKIAERKALILLGKVFGKRAYNQIVNKGEVWATGKDGRYYRIFWSRHGNVAVYEHRFKSHAKKAGKPWLPTHVYCGHFGEDFPISDQIIAQILLIKTNPEKYIEQANLVKSNDYTYCGPESGFKEKIQKVLSIEV
jgi:hypothetical protein